jgi:recombinational DNA repair protein RecR
MISNTYTSTIKIATDIKEVKKKTLESLWKMLKKGAFSFKSVDFEVCKILTSRTTYQICITNNKDKTRRILGVKDDKEIVFELSKILYALYVRQQAITADIREIKLRENIKINYLFENNFNLQDKTDIFQDLTRLKN